MKFKTTLTVNAAASHTALLLFLLVTAPVTQAGAEICSASGKNLDIAKEAYNRSCSVPFKDCDPAGDVWICASHKIDGNSLALKTVPNKSPAAAQRNAPAKGNLTDYNCSASGSTLDVTKSEYNKTCSVSLTDCDHLGDRWICANYPVEESDFLSAAPQTTLSSETFDTAGANLDINSITGSDTTCIDSDGDGWGWTGTESCKIGESPAISSSYDYKNTQTNITTNSSGSSVRDNCNKLNSGNYHITELVTDVFLSAGQSNATGGNTNYNPWNHNKDRVNDRIIVWTENNQWEIADPDQQKWHNGKYPNGHNHPAFQIARAIADSDSCRVVAFIATAASGMPIDHWRHDVDGHYSSILHTVPSALNALPGKYKIDMIWWMQGEADDDQIVERYFQKLSDLINRFRSQNWFDTDGLFLANETRIHHYANDAIRQLAADSSPFTDFSRGADSPDMRFPSITHAGVHFNATSLRQIGDVVARKYLNEYLPLVNK